MPPTRNAPVAQRTDTRPVDAIYITPGAGIAVTEKGGLRQRMRDRGQRRLILGLGALCGMTQGEFSAILAHEYGHFRNRDTAGGRLALQVRLSVFQMAQNLAARGLAHSINPAWLFIRAYDKLFLRITLGASRLQEILADRYAAMTYGPRNLVDGLTRVIRQDLTLALAVNREMHRATAQKRALGNIYELPAALTSEEQAEMEDKFSEIIKRPTSPYDSHPAFAERIRLLQPLVEQYDIVGNQEPVDTLFADLIGLQKEMLAVVQNDVLTSDKSQGAERAACLRESAKQAVPEIRPYYERLAVAAASCDAAQEAEAWQDLGEAYMDRELPARAVGSYMAAVMAYLDLEDREGERVARYNMAQAYLALGQKAEAKAQMERVVALDRETDSADSADDLAALAALA